jgi:TadE-like protein
MTKQKLNRIARQFTSTEGSEIAEAAVVLPLVFMLLLGIVWFGRAFNIYSTITQAAQQGAITAARPTCATCACPSGITCPTDGVVATAVYAVMRASSVDPNQVPPSSNPPTPVSCVNPPALATCTHPNNITICRQALLNSPPVSATQPPQCGVVVAFQYPFQFYLPFTSLNLQTITLSAQAQSRMEN